MERTQSNRRSRLTCMVWSRSECGFHLLLLILAMSSLGAELKAQKAGISIHPDIRVFTMLAALHHAGLDLGNTAVHPVQEQIRQEFTGVPRALTERMRSFHESHTFGIKPDDLMSRYISLALLCEDPPEFKLSLPLPLLPPDAQSVYEFLEMARQFYAAGRVEAVWSHYRQAYDEAILAYQPVINQIILRTDGYLRLASGSFLDRQFMIIPELQAPTNSYNARNYRENYYLVFGPTQKLKIDEIRHQYLHFVLDHYALRYTLSREVREELDKFTATAPDLESRYREDQQFLVIESLIRAIELRMNKVPEAQAQLAVDGYVRAGALLTRHFFEIMPVFESSSEGIKIAYPNMIKAVAMDRIQGAFQAAQKAPLVSTTPPPEPSDVEKFLRNCTSRSSKSTTPITEPPAMVWE